MREIIVTTSDLMEIYGIKTRKSIADWTAAGMPKKAHGKYDLVEVIRWKSEKAEADDSTAKDAKERYWQAKADNEEDKRDENRANLIARSELEPEWCARVGEVCQGLDSLSITLPPLLEGRDKDEMRDVIKKQTNALRNTYAREGRFTPAQKKKPAVKKKAPTKKVKKCK